MNFTPNSSSFVDALADVGLVTNAVLALAVLVLYVKNFHWWWTDKEERLPNVAGRSFVVFMATHVAVLFLNASARWFGTDYAGRDWLRLVVYWLGVVGGVAIMSGFIYYLVIEKRRDKLVRDLLTKKAPTK